MSATKMIEEFAVEGLVLEMDAERKVSRCVRPSKKARIGYVSVFHIQFHSVERMFEHAEKHLAEIEAKRVYKAERAAKKKEATEMARNSVIVDDIFVCSWGYEQTQVDAYQVVEKIGNATVVLRPIACRTVEGSEGRDCQNVVPVYNAFTSEETITKRIGEYGITMNSYSSAYQWDGKREFYNSWYY
jgi:capsid portal protein